MVPDLDGPDLDGPSPGWSSTWMVLDLDGGPRPGWSLTWMVPGLMAGGADLLVALELACWRLVVRPAGLACVGVWCELP